MKVAIRTIRIPVKVIKPGYVVLIDNYLGEVVLVTNSEVKVKYPDETEQWVPIQDAKENVAKFLAQTDDLRTYPLIHEDFYKIMWQFDTREKCLTFLKKKATAEGTFKNIPLMPKNDDIIEVLNIDIAEAHKMDSKHKRIGVILNSLSKYKYNVSFGDKCVALHRTDFKIVSSDDSKQVFSIKD